MSTYYTRWKNLMSPSTSFCAVTPSRVLELVERAERELNDEIELEVLRRKKIRLEKNEVYQQKSWWGRFLSEHNFRPWDQTDEDRCRNSYMRYELGRVRTIRAAAMTGEIVFLSMEDLELLNVPVGNWKVVH